LVLFIHITRLAANEIFSPSNKIRREVRRAKDLSAPLYEFSRKRSSAEPWLGHTGLASHFIEAVHYVCTLHCEKCHHTFETRKKVWLILKVNINVRLRELM